MVLELTIIPGIGLWHVHRHQDSCYVRYASNFIEGIGQIDGEIMETLWACLNLISPAAQGMSSLHRKECLDYQMNNSNFCKMIRIKRTLCHKFKQVKNGIAESEKAFERLNEAALANSKTEWLASERIAQSSRINNPAVMDVYEINIKKAPSKKEIKLRLLEEGNARNAAPAHRSVATWISMGLAIEEAQIALLIKIDGFTWSALMHLREGFDADDDPNDLNLDILNDLNDDPADFTETSDTWTNSPELTVIPLPSNLGVDRCRCCMVEDLIALEMSLHEGQANDALHNLQIHLCNKASQIASPENSSLVPGDVSAAGSVPPCQYIYKDQEANDATGARAGPASEIQTPALRAAQISTAVGDPNARGQSNESLTWFWSVEVDLGGPDHSWNEEFYRVHWLQAKSLRNRWKEELLVVESEMDWTCNFFLQKAAQWIEWMGESSANRLQGHACYLGRQSRMYLLLAQDAQAAFQDLKCIPIDDGNE
ncbi:hypothetical protein EDB19DRAFT_1834637 [Suillus lakei]|nr:hypothetical protein EDB19DRAFT_1834637 [Suillus lakei]